MASFVTGLPRLHDSARRAFAAAVGAVAATAVATAAVVLPLSLGREPPPTSA